MRSRVVAPAGIQQGSLTVQHRRSGAAKRTFEGRVPLDRIDLEILSILQREGRITKAALAERVHLSPSACHERLRLLEKHKVIVSYHASVNLRAIASMQMFFTEITLKTHHAYDFRRFEAYIANIPEIVECHALGGGIDYIAKVVAQDVSDYQALIEQMLEAEIGIDRYFTYVVTKPIKSLPQFPLASLL